MTRWIFTDENNAEVRSLVSSRYPLLNLVTGFLSDLPGQLPSRNHNRIIAATDKALPKQSASLGPSNPSSVQHRPGKVDARAEKALLLKLCTSLLHLYSKSREAAHFSLLLQLRCPKPGSANKTARGTNLFVQPEKAYALFFSARPRVRVCRSPGTWFKLRYY